jgi:small conductance mechanosensitive channel
MGTPENWQALWTSVVRFLPQLAAGLVVFLVFWLLARGLRRVVERLTHVQFFDPNLTRYIGRFTSVALTLVGLVTALGTMGVDVSALVAGLGLSGFALSFALKDIISNALSGILVMLYKPFLHHDRISVSGFEGTVVQIDLRYTVLDADGKTILIPNSSLFTNPVTVLQRGPAATSAPSSDTPMVPGAAPGEGIVKSPP